MDGLYVALERNDEVAIEKYKELLQIENDCLKYIENKENNEVKK